MNQGLNQSPLNNSSDQWIEKLCCHTDELLWKSYGLCNNRKCDKGEVRMLFPLKGDERRVSEQEARFAFICAFINDSAAEGMLFAPENPTKLTYRFTHLATGENGKRAQTDISIYDQDNLEIPKLNIEFKAGGYSPQRNKKKDIAKDCAKLLAEGTDGLWYHLLRKVDGQTIRKLLTVIKDNIFKIVNPNELAAYLGPEIAPAVPAKRIAFHLCILEPSISVHRVLNVPCSEEFDDFFTLNCDLKGNMLNNPPDQGWRVHQPQDPICI